ncbi:MAG: SagB/ThcOx family dehydrogenase [Thermoleophilia bacterium]|nr:SagB/ThcOx family dehydrogenase [Thermoleophilia bacterium]
MSQVTSAPVVLPAPTTSGPLSLEEAIKRRRSVREFTSAPLTLAEIGQLLWAAQGITSPQGARAAPSAGGTYPLEIYLVAGRVTDLAPGIYRYRPAAHDLVPLAEGDYRAALAEAGLNQTWIQDAPVDFVVSGIYKRTTDRYGERGIRYVHLEAGHAAQNLCLQATALGLGAVTVGAFSDEKVRQLLGMTKDEQPLYIIPVGHPAC